MSQDDEAINDLMEFLLTLPADEREKLRDVVSSMLVEIREIAKEGSDILFMGSDGRRVVKGLHFPREVLGSDGPVILPSAFKNIIIGAFSDEFVEEQALEIEETIDGDDERQAAWEELMNTFAIHIAFEYDASPPGDYDLMLEE